MIRYDTQPMPTILLTGARYDVEMITLLLNRRRADIHVKMASRWSYVEE